MRCPDCKENGDVKWMLRHQKENEEDEGTNANVITTLCVTCGKNESVFITDYLEEMFPSWDERPELIRQSVAAKTAAESAVASAASLTPAAEEPNWSDFFPPNETMIETEPVDADDGC